MNQVYLLGLTQAQLPKPHSKLSFFFQTPIITARNIINISTTDNYIYHMRINALSASPEPL